MSEAVTNEPDPTAHSADCWRTHPDCCAAEVERLQKELANSRHEMRGYRQNLVLLRDLLDKMAAEVDHD